MRRYFIDDENGWIINLKETFSSFPSFDVNYNNVLSLLLDTYPFQIECIKLLMSVFARIPIDKFNESPENIYNSDYLSLSNLYSYNEFLFAFIEWKNYYYEYDNYLLNKEELKKKLYDDDELNVFSEEKNLTNDSLYNLENSSKKIEYEKFYISDKLVLLYNSEECKKIISKLNESIICKNDIKYILEYKTEKDIIFIVKNSKYEDIYNQTLLGNNVDKAIDKCLNFFGVITEKELEIVNNGVFDMEKAIFMGDIGESLAIKSEKCKTIFDELRYKKLFNVNKLVIQLKSKLNKYKNPTYSFELKINDSTVLTTSYRRKTDSINNDFINKINSGVLKKYEESSDKTSVSKKDAKLTFKIETKEDIAIKISSNGIDFQIQQSKELKDEDFIYFKTKFSNVIFTNKTKHKLSKNNNLIIRFQDYQIILYDLKASGKKSNILISKKNKDYRKAIDDFLKKIKKK